MRGLPSTGGEATVCSDAIGRSGFTLSNIANTDQGRIGVRVYISNKVAGPALEQLLSQREDIEKAIGAKLQWDPNPENSDKTIGQYKDVDLDDRDKWPDYSDWLVDRVAKFRKVFGPRIKKLDLTPTGEHMSG